MRNSWPLLLLLAAEGCGYHIAGQGDLLPKGLKTIAVPAFSNVTTRYDLARLMPKDTKYYIDPMHYTDAGSKEMAQLIAATLLPYLKEQFPSFSNGQCRSAASP